MGQFPRSQGAIASDSVGPLDSAVTSGQPNLHCSSDIVPDLLQFPRSQGVDVEAREQAAGRTALHLAVDRQLEEMVRYLVKEAMVDLGREDYSGLTALAFAESCRNQNILRLIPRGVKKQNK